MTDRIPTFKATDYSKNKKEVTPDYFFLEYEILPIKNILPHRSDYYFISICLGGSSEISANMNNYKIKKNTLITLSPQTIKNLNSVSDDYNRLALIFTKDFLMRNNINSNILDEFIFFDNFSNHILNLDTIESKLITNNLRKIQEHIASEHPFKDEIIRNQTNILLFEILKIYKQQLILDCKVLTRAEQIALDFQKLVLNHFKKNKDVSFYADLLFISPKHLTETIKAVTGKSAGKWIDELLILESKVLLQDATLTIANVSDILHFTNQSIFGRFFKNNVGMSPLGFKQIAN